MVSSILSAIRNITGYTYLTNNGGGTGGAFKGSGTAYGFRDGSSYTFYVEKDSFSANQNYNSTGNPMAGFATATSNDGGIRPYNISMIPIIIAS